MAKFKISDDVYKRLEKAGQNKANELANEAEKKLTDKYIEMLDWYYVNYQPKLDKYGVPYYIRTFNLYRSYTPYKRTPYGSRTIYYGGVKIGADKMKDYDSIKGDTFDAQKLLDKFIYNPSGTWHGGDWHGGYGEPASFNLYDEMQKYKNQLLDEYRSSCSVKQR